VLFGVWLVVAAARVAGLGIALGRVRRIVGCARSVALGPESLARLTATRADGWMPPRVLESHDVSAPVAAGAVGHYVLVPPGWTDALRRSEMTSVLCHEVAHLERGDHRVVILQELLASVLWFHPLIYLFNHILNIAREELCDNHAIGSVDRAAYCETLLRLARGPRPAPLRGASAMGTGRGSLEARVRGILDESRPTETRNSRPARLTTGLLAVLVFALIALPRVGAAEPVVSPARDDLTRTITRSFPAGVDAPLRFENLAGRIVLVHGDGPTVRVAATVRVGGLERDAAKQLAGEIEWVETRDEDGSTWWGLSFPADRHPTIRYPARGGAEADVRPVRYQGREVRIADRGHASIPSVEFDLLIAIPARARVAIRNAVGPIEGQHLASTLEVTAHRGSITLDDVRGPISATSDRGHILVSRLAADAVLRTGTGAIALTRATRGRIALTTRAGNRRIVHPRDADLRLTYSGDRAIAVRGGEDIQRISSRSGGRTTEMLARGSGGPFITLTSEAGASSVEFAP
jgi:hypothetical protein